MMIDMLQVRYVGFRDRPLEERQMRFAAGCREGHAEIVSHSLLLLPSYVIRLDRTGP